MKSKILVHDYCGHSFAFDLSKELTKRIDYDIIHVYSANSAGPKANFVSESITNLDILSIKSNKISSNIVKRFLQESFYGIKILRQLLISKPDLIISSNTPREAQKVIQIYSKIKKIPFIFWLQDIRSIAVKHILRKKSKRDTSQLSHL